MVCHIFTMPNQTVKNGLKAKKIKLPEMNFFLEKKLTKFSCTYWPLSFCKILKNILTADPELWGCAIFGPKMTHLLWTKFFGYKPLLLLWSTYWHFSFCKIKKNSYGGFRVDDAPFLGPKCPTSLIENFFSENLLMSLVSFIHA